MPTYKTLLPYAGQKRTGKLYDEPEETHKVSIVHAAKLITTDDGEQLIQTKTYTEDSGKWMMELRDTKHRLITTSVARLEKVAWSRLANNAASMGYSI